MHEDPSTEDIEKFSSDTGFCPSCGAEVWDEAFACPACDAIVEGNVNREPLASDRITRRSAILLVSVLVLAILGLLIRLF